MNQSKYIYPQDNRDLVYQFVITSDVGIYDSHNRKIEWNGNFACKTFEGSDSWQGEVAIKFSELGTSYDMAGRDNRGLCWFADSDEGWKPYDRPDTLEVVRKGDNVIIKLNVIANSKLDKPEQLPAYNSFLSSSKNLNDWSEPVQILTENDNGIYNHSICYDGRRFVMLIESNSDIPFTVRFAESTDMKNWNYIPGAVFGKDQYVGGPTLKYSDGYYYLMYVEYCRPRWWFETWLVRSKNLIDWEFLPVNPLISPDVKQACHPDCPSHPSERSEWRRKVWQAKDDYDFVSMEQCSSKGYECNASDADLCEHDGGLRIYFTGGCQHWGGLLQYMDIKQTMSEFFASCFPE